MRLLRSSSWLILRVLVLSLILSQASGADLPGNIRKLVVAPGPTGDSVKVSPSPSPNPSIVIPTTNGSTDSSPREKSVGSLTEDRCEATPYSCHLKNLTACVQFAEKSKISSPH
uniref:Uncharacterized protein n=1 Tax=Kalanchoe fedtschenkoi TaxID=63787 RepID=A0A7N0TH50_KALFE